MFLQNCACCILFVFVLFFVCFFWGVKRSYDDTITLRKSELLNQIGKFDTSLESISSLGLNYLQNAGDYSINGLQRLFALNGILNDAKHINTSLESEIFLYIEASLEQIVAALSSTSNATLKATSPSRTSKALGMKYVTRTFFLHSDYI